MTDLMGWVRRVETRRATVCIAVAAWMSAIAGCEDRTSNADTKRPLAVTESGIDIMEVTQHHDQRIVEAVVVAGGEERQVTFEPYLDGPLPFAVVSNITTTDGGSVQLTMGRDDASGVTYVRQVADGESLELVRSVVGERVFEDYTCNGRFLHVEYNVLPPVVVDKTIAKYRRGESFASASADVAEYAAQLQAFEQFAAEFPQTFLVPNQEGELLTQLMSDPVFVGAVSGIPNPTRPDELCRTFTFCMALACKILPHPSLCTVCTAGAAACMFMDWFCYMWCGG